MTYKEKKRYRQKDGLWIGIIDLIDDKKLFPDGLPYETIEVILWNRDVLREPFVAKEYQRRVDKTEDKFLEPKEEELKYYSDKEIEEILIEKKYFEIGDTFSKDMIEKIDTQVVK